MRARTAHAKSSIIKSGQKDTEVGISSEINKNNSLFHFFDAFSAVLPSFMFLSVYIV